MNGLPAAVGFKLVSEPGDIAVVTSERPEPSDAVLDALLGVESAAGVAPPTFAAFVRTPGGGSCCVALPGTAEDNDKWSALKFLGVVPDSASLSSLCAAASVSGLELLVQTVPEVSRAGTLVSSAPRLLVRKDRLRDAITCFLAAGCTVDTCSVYRGSDAGEDEGRAPRRSRSRSSRSKSKASSSARSSSACSAAQRKKDWRSRSPSKKKREKHDKAERSSRRREASRSKSRDAKRRSPSERHRDKRARSGSPPERRTAKSASRARKESKRKAERSASASEKKREKKRGKEKRSKSRSRSRQKGKDEKRGRCERSRSRSRQGRDDRKRAERSPPRRDRSRPRVSPVRSVVRHGGGFDRKDAALGLAQPYKPPQLGSAMAAAMMGQLAMPFGPRAGSDEIEAFLAMNPVDPEAASRLRSLPPHLQRCVLDRGPLFGTKNPSAVLIVRIRDSEKGRGMDGLGMPAAPPSMNADPNIERMIMHYNLDARAASMLRSLTPAQQALAAELPLHEARNPSAFVMAQLQLPRFTQPQMHGGITYGIHGMSGVLPAPPNPSMFQSV